ncbi:LysE family translocator [Phaeovulum vinaykumarii]|uniref:Threonine/homoserine/homoserine lactone efflux protein n=1 Tax=Phaeovulum vinaykumarii TaxID=407234 RepID=A0A1N7M226_9RHOB|nr:LysE family translocator [Phaeovulum vinaykumarii]SIS80102.1 Threonine/homoserine/homoserine lactone efflux protein [Phaeovulum vinaykumarii]SOC09404.1 threonine/homoserine/homoserine lactone efflux protein [Phaeovulum vinaykumarii]
MSLHLWLAFALAALALSLTPGPNALLALDHGARFGPQRALFTVAGAALAMVGMVAASLIGLGAVLAASETLFTALRLIGAGYLIWLGWRLWRAPGFAGRTAGAARVLPPRHRLFAQGFAVMVSNPKTLLFFTLFLPGFIDPGAPFWPQAITLGLTLAVIEAAVELALAIGARRLAPWLAAHARGFNRTMAAGFAAIGLALAAGARN